MSDADFASSYTPTAPAEILAGCLAVRKHALLLSLIVGVSQSVAGRYMGYAMPRTRRFPCNLRRKTVLEKFDFCYSKVYLFTKFLEPLN